MQKNYLLLFLVLLGLLGCVPLAAQLSDKAEISVLTCRRGDAMYNMYGHTAVRISDPVLRMDQVYNYGIFNFNEPGFVMKFLRGKLLYRLGKRSYGGKRGFANDYKIEKRSIIAQQLNLTTAEKNRIYQALELNNLPENRSYFYDFFFDNCSTRVRDLFRNELPGIQYPEEAEKPHTFRTLLDEFTDVRPWTDLGQDLIVGSVSDKSAGVEGEMFLPEFLFDVIDRTTLNHQPLVKETIILLDYEALEEKRGKIPPPWPLIVFGILLVLEIVRFIFRKSNSKLHWVSKVDKLWFFLLGIGGLVILFMWFGTDHLTTKQNLNLLWMSPLYLILAFRWSRGLSIFLGAIGLFAILISPMIQSLHPCVLLMIAITTLKILSNLILSPKTA